MKKIRIATRGSLLALAQSELVKSELLKHFEDIEVEIKTFQTTGDIRIDLNWQNSTESIKSLFCKEVEQAVLNNEADIAVHSLKDMLYIEEGELIEAAYLKREDAKDVLISRNNETIYQLPPYAKVGTSSLRRTVSLLQIRPDLRVEPIRGNLQRRMQLVQEGQYDAIVLAYAGIKRLGLNDSVSQVFDFNELLPASGQGVICIQAHKDNTALLEMLSHINDQKTYTEMQVERKFGYLFDGGCMTPVGCYAQLIDGQMHFDAMYYHYGQNHYVSLICDGPHFDNVAYDAKELMLKQMRKQSTVTFVGAGPGDVDLITLKGIKAIQKAQCILYDSLINTSLLDYASSECELIFVGKRKGQHSHTQDEISVLLLEKTEKFQQVVRLKGGDNFIFGRGGEELLFLEQHGVMTHVIPGISSVVAAPASYKIPLTHRGVANSFHVYTAQFEDPNMCLDYPTIARQNGTQVFLMAATKLQTIARELLSHGMPATHKVAIIVDATLSTSSFECYSLKDIVDFNIQARSPAVIVIGDVVDLSEHTQKVFNHTTKRIMVTRDENQALEMCQALQRYHLQPVRCPMIKIDLMNRQTLTKAFVNEFDYIIFNSVNGVKTFFEQLSYQDIDKQCIAAVGKGTYQALKACNVNSYYNEKIYSVDSLLQVLNQQFSPNSKILVLTSSASPINKTTLENKYTGTYETVCAYTTQKTTIAHNLLVFEIDRCDMITLLSSSAVDSLMHQLSYDTSILMNKKIASIGKKTSQTIMQYGLTVDVQASVSEVEVLVSEISDYYQEEK